MLHYNKNQHTADLIESPYYKNLVLLRSCIEKACDTYFAKFKAPKVDLYLISKEVSSPIAKGSDSKPLPLQFGRNKAYLADSAQFGMEPLVLQAFEMVYCYLPSFRGEDPDNRHLNQFYQCEAEVRGDLNRSMNIVEGLIKHLIQNVLEGFKHKQYTFDQHNFREIESTISKKLSVMSFDEAVALLERHGFASSIKYHSYGRTFTNQAEIQIGRLVGDNKYPVWITHYDRDAVAFYQKPDPQNTERVLNADLIVPSLNGGYGGELVGAGQRQNSQKELVESMKRQCIENTDVYKWYIELRKNPFYTTTSGFGFGIERFVAWILGLDSIVDAAIYPVIKD